MEVSKAIIIQNTLIQNLNNCVNTATTYCGMKVVGLEYGKKQLEA